MTFRSISHGRPGSTIYRAVTALAVLATLSMGCDPRGNGECDPTCSSGEVCNRVTGDCVPVRLTSFEGDVPGRGLTMTATQGRVFLGTIDPQNGYLLVGTYTREGPQMYILRQFQRVGDKAISMASNDQQVVVGWLDDDDRFRLAAHQLDGDADRWRTVNSRGSTTLDYRGSHDFDVAIDNAGAIHLAFRDAREGTFNHISIDDQDGWALQTVDERSPEAQTPTCPDGTIIESDDGLGRDPALLVRGSDLLAAYQDMDCGDLRLARRLEDGWAVSTVDKGTASRSQTTGRSVTGRFASIAADSSGRLALAYFDVTLSRLVFAFQRDGEFQYEVADPGFQVDEFSQRRKQLVGPFASLVFDESDVPWIAYMDTTNSVLKLAHRTTGLDDSGPWRQQTVDAPPPTGFYGSLIFDPQIGLVVGTESLQPGLSGFSSELEVVEEGALR